MGKTTKAPISVSCQQCLSSHYTVTELRNCGQPWKVVISCRNCGVSSSATTEYLAKQRFNAGQYDLEVDKG